MGYVTLSEKDNQINCDAFRQLFEQSADGMLLLDGDVFIDCNQSAVDLFGCQTKAQLCSLRPSDISPAFQPDGQLSSTNARRLIDAAFQLGSLRFDWLHTRMNGDTFLGEVVFTPIIIEKRSVLLAVVRDITDRQRAQDELWQMNQTLEARIAARTRELERRKAVAESLRDTLQVVNSGQSLQKILDYLVQQASDLLEATAGVIYHYQSASEQFQIEAQYHLPELFLDARVIPPLARDDAPGYPLHIITDLNQPETCLTPFLSAAMIQPWLDLLRQHFGAYLGVPLFTQATMYGILGLFYIAPRDFTEHELDLAVTFGNQAALAIENARLRTRAAQAAVAAERGRLARDLHDSVTQTLFSASLIAEVVPDLWERNPATAREQLQELRQLTRGAMAEMRTLLMELRPETIRKAPLRESLRHLVDAAAGRAGIPVSLDVSVDIDPPSDVKESLYRVAQEALNNIVKHADASEAQVSFYEDDLHRVLRIGDDGRGFDVGAVSPNHLGLCIMRERALSIGAALEIDSQPGHGTRIIVIGA